MTDRIVTVYGIDTDTKKYGTVLMLYPVRVLYSVVAVYG